MEMSKAALGSLNIPRPMGTMKLLDWPACSDQSLSLVSHTGLVSLVGRKESQGQRLLELGHLLELGFFSLSGLPTSLSVGSTEAS